VVWSPDGRRLVTASEDKTARVWNADGTGEPLVLRGHEDKVEWAEWSPDGQRLVTASQDKTVRVWSDLSPLDGGEDPRLWTATSYCMTVALRIKLLGVSEAMAQAGQAACERRARTPLSF
jgi:dipeptidyl aminopeptidase/acylaminoacyl peptidase